MTYTVVVIGAPPPDLARKIAEAHAQALKSVQRRRKQAAKWNPTIS